MQMRANRRCVVVTGAAKSTCAFTRIRHPDALLASLSTSRIGRMPSRAALMEISC